MSTPRCLALAEAEDAGLIQRGAEAGTYDLRHGLVRETVYEDLNTAQRMELHLAIGRAFESLSESEPGAYLAELAHHFTEAAAFDHGCTALRYAMQAARRAIESLAYDAAAEFLRRALAALDFFERPDPTLRCEILAELCGALVWCGVSDDDLHAVADEGMQLARLHGRWDLLARIAIHATYFAAERDVMALMDVARAPVRLPELREPLEEALRKLPPTADLLAARIYLALTALSIQGGEMIRTRMEAKRASELARSQADPWLRVETLFWRCLALPPNEALVERLELSRECTMLCRATGFAEGEARSCTIEAPSRCNMGIACEPSEPSRGSSSWARKVA